jgi:hypothetical protein
LGAGDAQFALHPFGYALKTMLNRPQQAHEVQDRVELILWVQSSCR